MQQSVIETDRLQLRYFELEDAQRVQILAGDPQVSSVTANIPFPYADGLAEQWISSLANNIADKSTITYAICLKENGQLIGCISMMNLDSIKPELGYWLGVDYWGSGYCTEACNALIAFCTTSLNLTTVYGKHLVRNPASGKVMAKCGLRYVATETQKNGFMEKPEAFNIYQKSCA